MLAPADSDPALQIVAISCLLIILSIVTYQLAQYQRRRRRRGGRRSGYTFERYRDGV